MKLWLLNLDSKFALLNSLSGDVKLTRNADPDKYSYSGYGTAFDLNGTFSLSDGKEFGKNVIIFGLDNSSSVPVDGGKEDILLLGKGLADGLYDTTLTAVDEYSINFSGQQNKFCLSLHYNGSNSFLFANAVKIY